MARRKKISDSVISLIAVLDLRKYKQLIPSGEVGGAHSRCYSLSIPTGTKFMLINNIRCYEEEKYQII